jgi:hypothetical protein
MHCTPPGQQPGVRQEADETWSVVQGDAVIQVGFATMALAWSFIDRRETHSLSHTNAMATHLGAYSLKS